MPSKKPLSYLRDIRDSILLIEEFVRGMNLDTYCSDTRTQAAVERKLLVISEAAVRLGGDAEILSPGVPWRDIRGIGNWLRHQYDRVKPEIVWITITDDLPSLKAAVEIALKSD